jgi:putative hydrolase
MGKPVLTNSDIAELMAIESESVEGDTKAKALRRASAAAFMWPDEAVDLLAQNRLLTELTGVGPYVSEIIQRWIDKPPKNVAKSELRTGFLTLTEARIVLAKNPKWKKSYKGDLQMHTKRSDGSGTVQDMAEAAMERGYEYVGITDHSKGLKIAGGINEDELRKQAEEIDAVNATLLKAGKKFRVLKSIEMNLNPAGQGDMDPKALKKLDLVVGSFHSALRKTEDQTERYLAALNNPNVHILGHPRGRVYNYRIGLRADWRKVCDRAAELGKAVEIDSYPDRQDLDVDLLKLAQKAGCKIAIDTDAHHPWQLAFIELGLAAALKAGIQAKDIVNFLNVESLLKSISTIY